MSYPMGHQSFIRALDMYQELPVVSRSETMLTQHSGVHSATSQNHLPFTSKQALDHAMNQNPCASNNAGLHQSALIEKWQ